MSVQRIVFIDDDQTRRRQCLEWAKFKGYNATAYEDVFEANKHRADCYIFDVSAVCPMMLDTHGAYSPIASLAINHPGANIIITSAMSRNSVEDIIEAVQAVSEIKPIYGGTGDLAELQRALNSLTEGR